MLKEVIKSGFKILLGLLVLIMLLILLIAALTEGKTSSIEVLYLVIGALLALMSSFLTQRWVEERSERNKIEISARLVHLDIKRLLIIMRKELYNQYTGEYRITYDNFNINDDYVSLATNLASVLTEEELLLVFDFYARVSTIDASISVLGSEELIDVAENYFGEMAFNIKTGRLLEVESAIKSNDLSKNQINNEYLLLLNKLQEHFKVL